jgi:hypothetical protein
MSSFFYSDNRSVYTWLKNKRGCLGLGVVRDQYFLYFMKYFFYLDNGSVYTWSKNKGGCLGLGVDRDQYFLYFIKCNLSFIQIMDKFTTGVRTKEAV